jgi:hypothetical protein
VPGSEYRIVVGRWGNHCKFYIAPMKLLTCAIVYMNRSRYLLHDPWSVKCLIARRVQKEGDWYYSTLVQCEGSDCTCGKMVHPVCAVTTLVMARLLLPFCTPRPQCQKQTVPVRQLCIYGSMQEAYSLASNGDHL